MAASARGSPRAVLVDLDDTLLDRRAVADRVVRRISGHLEERYGVAAEAVAAAYREVASQLPWESCASGGECRRSRLRALLDRWPATRAASADDLADEFGAWVVEASRPFAGALEALAAWRAEGRAVMVVTEGYADTQWPVLRRLGLPVDRRHALVTSAAGVRKKDGSAYRLALQALEVDAVDAVMIGDNWSWDVVAPAACGIAQIWCSRRDAVERAPARHLGRVPSLTSAVALLAAAGT